jgi:hypothetical protein
MPRARAPRTAIEFVELVDKRGIADAQRVFGCSRRAAEDVILLARRAVACRPRTALGNSLRPQLAGPEQSRTVALRELLGSRLTCGHR